MSVLSLASPTRRLGNPPLFDGTAPASPFGASRRTRVGLRRRPSTADGFGISHSSRSQAAIEMFERAVFGVAAHKASTGADLDQAIAHDPHLVSAHVLKGFASLILARQELGATVGRALADAKASLVAVGGGTADEQALVRRWSARPRGISERQPCGSMRSSTATRPHCSP